MNYQDKQQEALLLTMNNFSNYWSCKGNNSSCFLRHEHVDIGGKSNMQSSHTGIINSPFASFSPSVSDDSIGQLYKMSSSETCDSIMTVSQQMKTPSDYVSEILEDIYSTSGSQKSSTLSSCLSTERPICYDFVQGRCKRSNCKYQHCIDAIVQHNSHERRICFDHLRGECPRGKLCRFSHDILTLVKNWLAECSSDVATVATRGICYDFCKGCCTRGARCQWTHNPIEIACLTAKNKPLDQARKEKITSKVIAVIYKEQLENDLMVSLSTLSGSPYTIEESLSDRQLLKAIEDLNLLSINGCWKSSSNNNAMENLTPFSYV